MVERLKEQARTHEQKNIALNELVKRLDTMTEQTWLTLVKEDENAGLRVTIQELEDAIDSA